MKKYFLLPFFLASSGFIFGQNISPELVSSSGGSFNTTAYQLDWSVGESVTAMHSADNYVVSQGFHQGSYIITAIENLRTDIEMLVYPNPTSDFIDLKVETSKVENLQYTITDFSGKVLYQDKIENNYEQIDFSNYSFGTYFISITKTSQLIKLFKIIKK